MHLVYALSAAAYLALAAALPKGGNNPNDKTRLNISNYYEGEVLDKINKPCTDELVTNAENDAKAVWEGLGCQELFTALGERAWGEKNGTSLSYVEFMSNKIHGPENWNCGDIENPSCNDASVQCDDTEFSCGYKILNSLAAVHNMYKRGFDHIQSAHDRLQDEVPWSFKDEFCPDLEKTDSAFADLIVGIVTLSMLSAGAMAQIGMKNAAKATERGPIAKDGLILSAGMATPLTLNHLDDGLQGETTDSQLAEVLGKVYDTLIASQQEQLEKLFDGSEESFRALSYFLQEGAFTSYNENSDWYEIESEIMKLFLGALIPKAWYLNPNQQNGDYEKWSYPFFVNSNQPCGSRPDYFYYYTEDADFTEICYEDEAWYLMAACIYTVHGSSPKVVPTMKWGLYGLPGDPSILREEGYHGITAKDMLISSVEGWKQAGHVQDYKMSTDTPLVTGKDPETFELHYTDGVRHPGFVNLLVCPDWEVAMGVMEELKESKAEQKGRTPSDSFPCG